MEHLTDKLLTDYGIYGIFIFILVCSNVATAVYLKAVLKDKTNLAKAFSKMQKELNDKIEKLYVKYSDKVESLMRERGRK